MMNQLIAVALGGAFGAVLRFLIATGVDQWLGREFPYGTLTVNIIGSFLMGLMTEALLLQRVFLSMEYRLAILVGLFGSLTTFSSFSFDTLTLIEQGQFSKASLNIVISVFACILAVWIGLEVGKGLFIRSNETFHWISWVTPYSLVVVNFIGAFLLGIVSTLLSNKVALSLEYNVVLTCILMGVFITLSSLYLVLYYIEQGYSFETHLKSISVVIASNIGVCSLALWVGFLAGKQI